MTQRFRLAHVLLGCLLTFAVGAQAQQASSEDIDRLLQRSGIEHFLEALPQQVGEGLAAAIAEDPDGTALLADSVQSLQDSANTTFASGQLAPVIRQVLERRIDADVAREVLAWLDSPLGTRLTLLENVASSPDFPRQLEAYMRTLPDNPPAAERLELLQELDRAANITESGIEVVLHMQLALVVAVVETLPEQQRPTIAELLQSLESERPAIEQMLKQVSLSSLLFTYRDVSDADLQQYIAFLGSPAGKLFQSSLIEGLDLALIQAVRRWGNEVGRTLKAATQRRST